MVFRRKYRASGALVTDGLTLGGDGLVLLGHELRMTGLTVGLRSLWGGAKSFFFGRRRGLTMRGWLRRRMTGRLMTRRGLDGGRLG